MSKTDPPSIDLFPGACAVVEPQHGVPASRFPWTRPMMYRVHYYDGLHSGTRHAYFDSYQEARDFAQSRRVYAKPCVVERRPALVSAG